MNKISVNDVAVIVVAAGRGSRMGLGFNKVFADLGGMPLLLYSLDVFEAIQEISSIVIVTGSADIDECKRIISSRSLYKEYHKVSAVVVGGETRQDSVQAGLTALQQLQSPPSLVLVHDGARPCILRDDVQKVIEVARMNKAAILAVPVKETLKQATVDDNRSDTLTVDDTVDRSRIWAAQTPQAFEYTLLIEAYKSATDDGYIGTDDCSLVERLGCEVRLVHGSYSNIKVTTPDDLAAAKAFMGIKGINSTRRANPSQPNLLFPRVGNGYDVHRLVPDRKLILGGVEFAHPDGLGLLGHSDADVLCHAIADAILGAAVLGDIGVHFPPGNPAYAGISSLEILHRTAELVRNAGFCIDNVDATLICERPKVMGKALEIRSNIALALGLSVNVVSVKATTNEGLGAIGSGEGICAHAVALLTEIP